MYGDVPGKLSERVATIVTFALARYFGTIAILLDATIAGMLID